MSSPQTINAFLKQYLEDQSSGRRRTLGQYLEMFPGDNPAVAEQYAEMESEALARVAGVPAERIGPYRVRAELGRGGQGVVYLAEDERLHRTVALKVLTGLGSLSPNRVARFLREAEVASRLDHPGIATVYEIGTDGGVPFIAMRFVEGETLAAQISRASEGGWDREDAVKRAVAIAEKAARALHAAHELGIVHRDVKPGNILVQADGDPVIVDFGLAHDSDTDLATLTRTGEFFGTPAYMSPEQIATHAAKPDRRTDVWSLGATLYECLTLHRPFEAPTREQLYRSVLSKEPRSPRRLNAAIPEDLAAILEMALQKEVDRRYETAGMMADDLAAFAEGRPVSARAIGPLGRLRRWSRREPAKAGFLGLALVAIPVIAVLLINDFANRETLERARLARIEEERDDCLSRGAYELGEGDSERAITWFERAAAIEGSSAEAVAGIVQALLKRNQWTDALAFLEKHGDVLAGLRTSVLLRARALGGLGRESEAASLQQSAPIAANALDHYLSGIRLLEEGHLGREPAFREALGEFRRAIYESTVPRAIYFQGLAHAAFHDADVTASREAAGALRKHWPSSAMCAYWAGTALMHHSAAESIIALREAIRLDPKLAEAHCNLGNALISAGSGDAAIDSYRAAIRLQPDLPEARRGLGSALRVKGDLDGAIASYREAIRVLPRFPDAFFELGLALEANGQVDDAIAAQRASIRHDPSGFDAHWMLGRLLSGKGLVDEAIEIYRAMIALRPGNPEGYYNLGIELRKKGLAAESIAAYREAIRFRPSHAEAHCNLGRMLVREGWFWPGLAEIRQGHELGSRRPDWQYPSADWVRDAEDLVREEARMLGVATGKEEASDAQDLVELADLALRTRRWRLATNWFEAAFTADPSLTESIDQWPLKAARAAIQAAASIDAESRPSEDSSRLRGRALGWLQIELRRERDLVDTEAWDEGRLRASLAEWASDPMLGAVRDSAQLSRLPASEAQAWAEFWAALR